VGEIFCHSLYNRRVQKVIVAGLMTEFCLTAAGAGVAALASVGRGAGDWGFGLVAGLAVCFCVIWPVHGFQSPIREITHETTNETPEAPKSAFNRPILVMTSNAASNSWRFGGLVGWLFAAWCVGLRAAFVRSPSPSPPPTMNGRRHFLYIFTLGEYVGEYSPKLFAGLGDKTLDLQKTVWRTPTRKNRMSNFNS